jgi:hypothetical protein
MVQVGLKEIMSKIKWDIRHEGHSWSGEEAMQRYELTPEKIEMYNGKLFWNDDERLNMLALLLENIGIDRTVQLGESNIWREAIEKLKE